MKLATVVVDGKELVAVATDDLQGLLPLAEVYRAADLGEAPVDMRGLLARGEGELARIAAALPTVSVMALSVDAVQWLPPVPAPTLALGVAMNNGRLNDTAQVEPAGPMFFVKPQSSLIGHGETVEIADDYGFTFPELELAVVIGKKAKNVPEDEALDIVAGYTIINDITSQGLKNGDSIATDVSDEVRATPGYEDYFSWRHAKGEGDNTLYFTYHARSKGSDTFGPMGPFLTTRDEVPNPDALAVRGYADGELFAEDSTASYSYSVARIVSWASRNFTLRPGDIVFCGTAAKGNEKFPRAHHNIDISKITPVMEVEIEGLGRLRNPVAHVAHERV